MLTSWNALPQLEREYALLALPAGAEAEAAARYLRAAGLQARSGLLVLEIVPLHAHRLEALQHALGGAGRPAGVVDAALTEKSLVLELNPSLTPLCLLVDLVDVELESAPGRRIRSLFALSDDVLTAFARDRLGDPRIDASRLIETYVAPLLDAAEEYS